MDQLTKEKYAKLFFIGSLWNMIAAGIALIVPKLGIKMILGFKNVILTEPLYFFYKQTWGLVFVFGMGYYMFSRNPEKNREIVWMGIFGKIAFFLTCVMYYCKKAITPFMLLGGFGDFVFTILFANFLFKTKNDAKNAVLKSA